MRDGKEHTAENSSPDSSRSNLDGPGGCRQECCSADHPDLCMMVGPCFMCTLCMRTTGDSSWAVVHMWFTWYILHWMPCSTRQVLPRSTASVCCPDEAPQSRVIELSHDVCKSLTHRLAQSCCMTSPSHPHGIKVLIRNKGASLDAGTELTQSKVCRSVTPFFMGRSVGSGLVMMVQPDGEPGRRDWAQSAVCLTGREVCS